MAAKKPIFLLKTLSTWNGASQRKRLEAVEAVKQHLSGSGAWKKLGTSRWGPGVRPAKGEGTPIGILFNDDIGEGFHLVPGGELRPGLSAAEIKSLKRLLKTASPEARAILDHIDQLRAGRKKIKIPPMLVARLPLRAEGIREIDSSLEVEGDPALLDPKFAETVAQKLGMSLPTEAEWEWACRAGTRSLFFWGDEMPTQDRWTYAFSDARPSNTNCFGLIGMGAFPELCAGGIVRGGAEQFYPWQDAGEWLLMLCALRGDAPQACLRLVIRLDDLAGETNSQAKPRPKQSATITGSPPTSFDSARDAAKHAEHAKVLTLSQRKLRRVPAAVKKLVNLEELDLGTNWLEEIPDFIFDLSALRKLDIHGNDLATVPKGIGRLRNLEQLAIGYNPLKRLSAALFKLSGLRILDLSWSTDLRSIPKGITKLQQLERLDLKQCKSLRKFPEVITELRNLREIVLSDIDIVYDAHAVKQLNSLPRLERLDLSENPDLARHRKEIRRLLQKRIKILF
jgi:Leucine-rich repeat (LRR) protein